MQPILIAGLFFALSTSPSYAETRWEQWKEQRQARQESKTRAETPPSSSVTQMEFEGRTLLVHVPDTLPASGERALVLVLHGGMGNAAHIQKGLGMDDVADKYGFIVVYPNGTPVTRIENKPHYGWNAGNCCGQSALKKIDDTGYLAQAVSALSSRYGVDQHRIYVMGHSNGAMMTQRLMCEKDIFQAAMPISGPLGLTVKNCPPAKGKKILAVHGKEDLNVPIEGGKGTKGISNTDFNSQAYSKQVFETSGATYTLDIVDGADHNLLNIDKALKTRDGKGIAETAIIFFGLDKE